MKTEALYASNAGVRLAYESAGDGPPVLLVQGLGYGRWGWEPVVEPLAGGFRVVTFDNRGIGESDIPRGPYTAEQLAADCMAVLDAAGIERSHVVGTSLGGMVAQTVALTYPGRVDRLVLACTTPGGPGSYPIPEPTLRLFAEAPLLDPKVALRRFVENALSAETVAERPELVDRILELRLSNPFDLAGWQAQLAAGTSFDVLDHVDGIRAPTLVVSGTADTVVDARNSELLAARIPGARLELFRGLGHLFFWEEPERFARLVTEFLHE